MLPDVVVFTSPVPILETLKARVRHILLVLGPADAFVLEQVHNGGYIAGDGKKVVAIHTEVFPGRGGDIVGLTGMGHTKVICQGDTLLGQFLDVG